MNSAALPSRPWQEVAADAQRTRELSLATVQPPLPPLPAQLPLDVSSLPSAYLSPDEACITSAYPEDLLRKIACGQWSSEQVTSAFLRRAVLAQRLTNCLTELLPQRALDRSRYLDAYLKQHGRPVGPLHGLPISVKEHIAFKGLTVDGGFVCDYGTVSHDEALIITILHNAGAVFHARTTQPQTIMHLETASNLYGTTTNPFCSILTAGGSSGGEGALIGMRGSCVGLGTDIGGSIRSPAANCGLYGFRPTVGRLPYAGIAGCGSGMEQIVGVVGPLATSLAGVEIIMKTVIDSKPWLRDPSLVPLPWKPEACLPRDRSGAVKLKVGLMYDDGVVRPHPPVLHALRSIASRLSDIPGVQVVPWRNLDHEKAWEIIASLYFPDGGVEEIDAIEASGEPWLPLSRWVLEENEHCRRMSIEEVWLATQKRDAYRAAYAQHWNDTADDDGRRVVDEEDTTADSEGCVDVILCPAGPGAAPKLGTSKYWGYTSLWNLLDYPALVMPWGKVGQLPPRQEHGMSEDEKQDEEVEEWRREDAAYVPRSDKDQENWEAYDEEVWRGVPVGVQWVGRRYEDDKVLAVVRYLEEQMMMRR